MRLFANFVSAVWGGGLMLLFVGLYFHSSNMITGGVITLIISTTIRLMLNAEAGA